MKLYVLFLSVLALFATSHATERTSCHELYGEGRRDLGLFHQESLPVAHQSAQMSLSNYA